MPRADDRPPSRKAQVPHLVRCPSSLSPLFGHFYPVHIKSRNQPNSMKANAGPDFYPEHLDTLQRVTDKPRFTRTLCSDSHRAFHSSSRAERGICCLPSERRITREENARNKLFREGTVSTPPPEFSISNRQWPVRLENAATCTKQSSGLLSNRHIWDPFSPDCRVEFMAQT